MLISCIWEAILTHRMPLLIQLHVSILQRTPFSHSGRAIVKAMAMTTGELDFDDLFHQQEGEDEIAFPPLSFLLWIIFLVLMPVLLSNLLVSYKIFWSCCSRLLSQVLGAKPNTWWLHWIAWLCAKESNSIIRCPQTVLYSTCVMTELELLMSQLFVKFLGTFSSIDSVSGWFWCVHCKEHLPTSFYRYAASNSSWKVSSW